MSHQNPLKGLKDQAEEVKNVLADTVKRLEERGEKADELNKQAEALNEKSKLFMEGSKRLEQKYWWRDKKWIIVGCAIGAGVLIIFGVLLAVL